MQLDLLLELLELAPIWLSPSVRIKFFGSSLTNVFHRRRDNCLQFTTDRSTGSTVRWSCICFRFSFYRPGNSGGNRYGPIPSATISGQALFPSSMCSFGSRSIGIHQCLSDAKAHHTHLDPFRRLDDFR